MEVSISHAYSRKNKGDAALTSALLAEVHQIWPEAHVTILTMEELDAPETFEGSPLEPMVLRYAHGNRREVLENLLWNLWVMLLTLLWAASPKGLRRLIWLPESVKRPISHYLNADVVLGVGGGYLRGGDHLLSVYNLVTLLHPMWITRLLKKPFVCCSQSVGPVSTEIEARLLSWTLEHCTNGVIVRESISARFLEGIGMRKFVLGVDDAFRLEKAPILVPLRKSIDVGPHDLVVGFTVRNWLSADRQASYERAVASVIDRLVEQYGANIVLFAQVVATEFSDDDRQVNRAVLSLTKPQNREKIFLRDNDENCHELATAYGQLDALVGTRFHSVIFSISGGVPAVAIEYEPKTSGIMGDIGLVDWVIKIEDVSEGRLFHLVQRMLDGLDAYRSDLQEKMKGYRARALETNDLLKEIVEEALKTASPHG